MEVSYERTAKVFKAFCDENRLKILTMLQTGEKCGCTLEAALPICQSTLSHHMKLLVESGIVKVRKDKKWSYYSLCDIGANEARNLLGQILEFKGASEVCTCEINGNKCVE